MRSSSSDLSIQLHPDCLLKSEEGEEYGANEEAWEGEEEEGLEYTPKLRFGQPMEEVAEGDVVDQTIYEGDWQLCKLLR